MRAVTFTVHGDAAPQGSVRAFNHAQTGRVIVTHSNRRTRPWRDLVAAEARDALHGHPPHAGPVGLHITITRTRPKSHFGARGLRPSAPVWPATRPDLDKLERAILDALTGIAYRDDAQVVELRTVKRYTPDPDTPPATTITILNLEQASAP